MQASIHTKTAAKLFILTQINGAPHRRQRAFGKHITVPHRLLKRSAVYVVCGRILLADIV